MKDEEKTKAQLIDELNLLREYTTKLERPDADFTKTDIYLHAHRDDLIRSERLAFTGRIAANIAHEIRNPLTNVLLSAQQLKKTIKSEDALVTEYVNVIRTNTERANYLITELLNSARPPKLNMHLCEIKKVIKDALDFNKTKISSKKVSVSKNWPSSLPKIKIDKEQMGRVFLNIIMNAVDAMDESGKLTVTTKVKKNHLQVMFQDTGKGIPQEDIIKIFDPFFSSKPGGVGLGLTICYGIVVSHSGAIEVESITGKGTVFTISLPFR